MGSSALLKEDEREANGEFPATSKVMARETSPKTRQKARKKSQVPSSELGSDLLVQPRRSARHLKRTQNLASHVSQKTTKSNELTPNTQEPIGSIITAFASVSGPKKPKTARAPPQRPLPQDPPSLSAEIERSVNNGSLPFGDTEPSSINPPPSNPEKPTPECRKTKFFCSSTWLPPSRRPMSQKSHPTA